MGGPILQQLLGNEFSVESVGWFKNQIGEPASADAIVVMRELGIDISGHRARWIGNIADLGQFSHIVCVNEDLRVKIRAILETDCTVLVANEAGGGIPDPYKKGLNAYRDCLSILKCSLPGITEKILGC